MPGVVRIALIGSICTDKPEPKDVDLLLTITPAVDMKQLAKLSRRLKGRTQRINHGADIFLSDTDGEYIGRVCRWKDCRPGIRMACEALHCGGVQHLYDDLQILKIAHPQITSPPLIIHPKCVASTAVPSDLMNEVRQRFQNPIESAN